MENSKLTCPEFIEILASKEPVPGGGGAAALCAAVGTALGNMVGSLTVGKKKYADVNVEMIGLKAECDKLEKRFLELIDLDAKAFFPLSKAYGMPKDTPSQIAEKEAVLEECSKNACMVPLEIMEETCKAIDIIGIFAEKGSRLAVSDAGCAAAVCSGALRAASLNIFINTKGLKDRRFADEINQKAEDMLSEYGNKANEIFVKVKNSLK